MLLKDDITIFLSRYKILLYKLYNHEKYINEINETIDSFLNFKHDENIICMFIIEQSTKIMIEKESPVTGDLVKHTIILPLNKIIKINTVDELYKCYNILGCNIYFYIITTRGKLLKNYIIDDKSTINMSDLNTKLNCLSNKFYNSSIVFDLNTDNLIKPYTKQINNINAHYLYFANYNFSITEKIAELLNNIKLLNVDSFICDIKKHTDDINTVLYNHLYESEKKENELKLLNKKILEKGTEIILLNKKINELENDKKKLSNNLKYIIYFSSFLFVCCIISNLLNL